MSESSWLDKAAAAWGAAREAWRYGTHAPLGRRVSLDKRLDGYRMLVSERLDFAKLRSLLAGADAGSVADGLSLFEEMEEKDGNLKSVAETRRAALTELDYEIVSAAEDQESGDDRQAANEAAEYVRDCLADINGLEEALEDLATAIGTNLAVAELVWELRSGVYTLVEVSSVSSRRLIMDSQVPGQVNVITEENAQGVAASSPKFVVHVPRRPREFPLVGALMRSLARVNLTKQLAISDWAVFCELYGMPIRTAKYRPGATTEEKQELVEMMENLGTRAFGVFSESVQLELIESTQRGAAPYQALIEACERTEAKAWLGGHLTSDTTGATGTYAAGAVQNEVREDLRDGDIKREAKMVHSQIIAPMCAFKFPRRDMPLPRFRRIKPEVIDRGKEAELIAKAQQAGLEVPRAWAHKQTGVPEPQRNANDEIEEPVLTPSPFGMGENLEEGGF